MGLGRANRKCMYSSLRSAFFRILPRPWCPWWVAKSMNPFPRALARSLTASWHLALVSTRRRALRAPWKFINIFHLLCSRSVCVCVCGHPVPVVWFVGNGAGRDAFIRAKSSASPVLPPGFVSSFLWRASHLSPRSVKRSFSFRAILSSVSV